MSRRTQIGAAAALLAARTALVSFTVLAFVLAPSVGHLAIQEHNWPARVIMLIVLAGIWVSIFALAAAREHAEGASG